MAVNTNQIWEEFSNKLQVFILKRVKSKHDAEDILQDVFLKIHNKIESLETEIKLKSWIYQITRNAIVDYYRNHGKNPKLEMESPEQIEDFSDKNDFESAEIEIASCIRPMVDDLPEKYKEAILMTEYQTLSQTELAKRLGLSISGAKSRVQRARKNLKNMLLECCHFEFDRLGKIIKFEPKNGSCKSCVQDS